MMNATSAAITSTPGSVTNQNPRKMTLPVMFATNTWPSSSTLTASTSPVANVSKSRPATVMRWETGDSTGTACGVPSYSCGVRSNDVTVDMRVINHFASWRCIVKRYDR